MPVCTKPLPIRTTRSFSQGSLRPGPCSSSRPPATASNTRRSASPGDNAPPADCITPDTSNSIAWDTGTGHVTQ